MHIIDPLPTSNHTPPAGSGRTKDGASATIRAADALLTSASTSAGDADLEATLDAMETGTYLRAVTLVQIAQASTTVDQADHTITVITRTTAGGTELVAAQLQTELPGTSEITVVDLDPIAHRHLISWAQQRQAWSTS